VRRQFFNWIAMHARDAARARFSGEASHADVGRFRAMRLLLFALRHAPDEVPLGDLYRGMLPARLAGRLCDKS